MVPACALISFVLLGIEEIGVQIEEPFSILALENLCRSAEKQINDMLAIDEGVHQYVSQHASASGNGPHMHTLQTTQTPHQPVTASASI